MESAKTILDTMVDDTSPAGATILSNMIDKKLKNWESYWVPYSELTDEIQEYDRHYARKIMEVLKEHDDR